MPEPFDHVLIGGGPASAHCVQALRDNGAAGTIALIARELDPPYDRPACSKGFLRGAEPVADTLLLKPDWYTDKSVELRTRTSVKSIDPAAKTITLQGGDELTYGSALLATGSLVTRLRVEGAQLDGIHYLRTLGNADAIRADAEQADAVAVVGGSFIACEAAASLTMIGKRVTLVMLERHPLENALGPAVGEWVRGLLEGHGVTILDGDGLGRCEGDERVERLVTESGASVDAELVVIGAGVTPDVALAKAAGLAIGERGGVLCDKGLQSAAADLYVAGDICEYDSVIHHGPMRVEHMAVAEAQGAHVAQAMLGSRDPYTEVPYFWSDLGDWATVEAVGPPAAWDDAIMRGSIADGAFSVLYLRGDRLVGCAAVDRADDLGAATDIIAAGGRLAGSKAELADPARPPA